MREVIGILKDVEYISTSPAGNSNFSARVCGVNFTTMNDSGYNSDLRNLEGKNVKVTLKLFRGRFLRMVEIERCETTEHERYITSQFKDLIDANHDIYKLKVNFENEGTNWLNVRDVSTLEKIRDLLIEDGNQ